VAQLGRSADVQTLRSSRDNELLTGHNYFGVDEQMLVSVQTVAEP